MTTAKSEPLHITFYFDFLCPFAYRTAIWMDMVQEQMGDALTVDWKYFSLEQSNTPADIDWKIWEQPEDYTHHVEKYQPSMRALLAFWGAEAARQQGRPAFDRFRTTLYHARHRDKLDMSQRPNIEQIAEQAELDMEQFRRDFANRDLVDALRRDHLQAIEQYQVFGVPTLTFDECNALFVKMMTIPPAEETLPLLDELRYSFIRPAREWLAEVKRPNPGKLR